MADKTYNLDDLTYFLDLENIWYIHLPAEDFPDDFAYMVDIKGFTKTKSFLVSRKMLDYQISSGPHVGVVCNGFQEDFNKEKTPIAIMLV